MVGRLTSIEHTPGTARIIGSSSKEPVISRATPRRLKRAVLASHSGDDASNPWACVLPPVDEGTVCVCRSKETLCANPASALTELKARSHIVLARYTSQP
jgi:hypothetical protein